MTCHLTHWNDLDASSGLAETGSLSQTFTDDNSIHRLQKEEGKAEKEREAPTHCRNVLRAAMGGSSY